MILLGYLYIVQIQQLAVSIHNYRIAGYFRGWKFSRSSELIFVVHGTRVNRVSAIGADDVI